MNNLTDTSRGDTGSKLSISGDADIPGTVSPLSYSQSNSSSIPNSYCIYSFSGDESADTCLQTDSAVSKEVSEPDVIVEDIDDVYLAKQVNVQSDEIKTMVHEPEIVHYEADYNVNRDEIETIIHEQENVWRQKTIDQKFYDVRIAFSWKFKRNQFCRYNKKHDALVK